ncbi:Tethering factor for nuclear proteasome sts1 [Parahypoxylon ruwenzoriense]
MNVLLSPQPPSFFPHQHDPNRRSPTRSSCLLGYHAPARAVEPDKIGKQVSQMLNTFFLTVSSPFHNAVPANRKRKADDDGDEMSVSPLNSPAIQSRQLATRPSKKIRSNELAGRPLALPRLLETLNATQLRALLQTICERQPDIGEEVVKSAPRPSVECALQVLKEYQDKLRDAFPYGESSSDYTYYRVKQPLLALIDALADFTPQYLPPNETSANVSLQYLDGATKIIHSLPEWESQSYRHHKENTYDEISKAWALVINEASKKGAGFVLHSGGWDQILAKHNQQSGGRLQTAMLSMAANVGWVGGGQSGGAPNPSASQSSILDQLMAGNYGSPVRVGPW